MPTGRPLVVKCPACKRGKYCEPPIERGCHLIGHTVARDHRGRSWGPKGIVECRDCGHVWRSKLERVAWWNIDANADRLLSMVSDFEDD